MATVQDLLASKGSQVRSIGPQASVLDAAVLMNEHKIGCLVVVEGERVVGMFSERDVLRRGVGAPRDPAAAGVGDVGPPGVICCPPPSPAPPAAGLVKEP